MTMESSNIDIADFDEEEDQPDPFAQFFSIHPALGVPHEIASDIYPQLFDAFFHSEIFGRWLRRKNAWQLYIIGGPGVGKTTMASLTIKRIRAEYEQSFGTKTHVSALFIRDGPIENELAFLEDSLSEVYRKFTPPGLLADHTASNMYDKYTYAQNAGRRVSVRIDLISQALQQRCREIQETGCAFLVIDNIEQCSPSLTELLLRQFSVLQQQGVGVLITSRLRRHGKLEEVYCDFHEPDFDESRLQFYRRCIDCEKHYVCETCDDAEKICVQCGPNTAWAEPEHLELVIDSIRESSMKSFIAWDLEREHGELGLGSDAHKPPLSSFGIAFRKAKTGIAGRKWVQEIYESVNGSVVQTKLALDRIHSAPSPDAITFSPNRIPANVQALLHAAIKDIEKQPTSQRDLALKSIAAVGKQGEEDVGITLSRLAGLLKGRPHISSKAGVPPRSAEDIFASTKGYLRLMPPGYDEVEYAIVAFNRVLFRYANEDYNDALVMANSQLRTSNIPRSFTRTLESSNATAVEPSWQDVVGELKRFESPKLLASSAQKSPPVRRRSSGLNRSITFDIRGISSPSVGLGLDPEYNR